MKSNFQYAVDFGIFEVGRVVDGFTDKNLCNEKKKLGITLFSKTKTVEQLYFELRDMIAVLLDDIKHTAVTFTKKEATHSYQHLKNLNAIVADGKEIGEMGVAHPTVAKKIDKKAAIVFAELDVTELSEIVNKSISYKEPSRFPEMTVDLSFVTEKFEPIANAIAKADSPLVKKVSVADIYQDENGKSITVRILFSHAERTLTREEVTEVTDAVIAELAKDGIALKN